MNYEDEIKELVFKAYEYDDAGKYSLCIPLLEKATSIAKENNDILREMYCKFDLTKAYIFSGQGKKGIITFFWCVAQMEKGYTNDEVVYQVLWEYKYILNDIVSYMTIPSEKINETFEKMKKLYLENNLSLSPYYSLKIQACSAGIDDGTSIEEYYKKWITSSVDDRYEDCKACNIDKKVSYYISIGDYKRALQESEDIINGRFKCAEVPDITFADLLIPVYSLGEYELAEEFHKKGLRLINGDESSIIYIAEHMMYLSITNVEKGIEVFQKNYPNLFKYEADEDKMWFNAASFALFFNLQKKDLQRIKLKIPKKSPLYSQDEYDVVKLKEFFEEEVKKFMDGFDKRNGNSVISDHVKKYLKVCNC
ncbi:hypothetical protein [uncultured Clostridium sp.]|uniref:hypothetical protein n=1 Tax=uncultured Clostridium sp. TaxID=59620 RepID=UPI0028E5FDB9|nr:hypothetical protein [uncultured Clostridium sp.]